MIVDRVNEDGSCQKTLSRNVTRNLDISMNSFRVYILMEKRQKNMLNQRNHLQLREEKCRDNVKSLLELFDPEMIPNTYMIKTGSSILLRRKVGNETVRTVDISLWLNLCPRTELKKIFRIFNWCDLS